MTTFPPELVDALPGAAWLSHRRRQAAAAASAISAPTTEEEIWRYSRIGEFQLDSWHPAPGPGEGQVSMASDALMVDEPAAFVELVDGHLVEMSANDDRISLVRLDELVDVDTAAALGSALDEQGDLFTLLNDAFAPAPVLVRVPRSVDVGERPVVIRHRVTREGAMVLPRVLVVVEELASVLVVEEHASAPVAAVSAPVTELVVGQAARMRYVSVQDLDHRTWQVGTLAARIERDAHLSISLIGLGGDYARLRTDTRMVGPGARGDITAIYHGEREQTLDFRTIQDHLAPHTSSDLLFKGAVDDRSRSIYTGNIRIAVDASDVTAFQTNRNIKLSPDAWAESVPNLEIENNDVRCSHASAVGPIDVDQRFYLESRGVPTEVAERLVVSGFFTEVLERLPVPSVATEVSARIADRLERHEAQEVPA